MRALTRAVVPRTPHVSNALPVVHLVNGMSALWGKERVIASLMRAQLDSGEVLPQLITFAPCPLGGLLSTQGFTVETLDTVDHTVSVRAFLTLRRLLRRSNPVLLHTHGYKANVIARAARASGVFMRGLVSTCHGWVDETPRLRLYNRIDRVTAFASDIVTVPDQAMLSRFPATVHPKYVANAIEDRRPASRAERLAAKAHFGLPQDRLLVGILGRTEPAKGVLDVIEAARRTADLPIQWLIAGTGPLDDTLAELKLPNVTHVGYVIESERYIDALDIYLQASHAEGMSLALLEAMRGGLPIVATRAGSTAVAVRDMREALLVSIKDVGGITTAIRELMNDPVLATQLATAARQRFENAFQTNQQHRAFLDIYRSCDRIRA